MRSLRLLAAVSLLLSSLSLAAQKTYSAILLARNEHPAVRSAAELMAKSLGIPANRIRIESRSGEPRGGEIVLAVAPVESKGKSPLAESIRGDGYAIRFSPGGGATIHGRSEEHTSELQSRVDLVCRLLLEKKKSITSIGLT